MAKQKYSISSHQKRSHPHLKWWFLGCMLLVIGLLAVLELTNTTHIFHKKTVPATIPLTANKSSSAQSKNNNSAVNNPGGEAQIQTNQNKVPSLSASNTSTLPLIQPYGTFVSNHRPGQNGTDTKEQSTCDSTPGATCYIRFTTSDGKSTELPSQTIGSDGSTIWANWDANILTSGEWQITAYASLNGQTKSATDPTMLEIK